MNTTYRRQISPALSLASITLAVAATVLGSAVAGIASEPRNQAPSVPIGISWSYDRPLDALGGDSLAQYLADHWAAVTDVGV